MGSLVRVQYRPRNPRSAKVGDFFIIAAEKDGVKHDQVRPPPQAQQESPQRTGRLKRTTWAFSPVTKKVESKKIYNRKKAAHVWKDDSSMSGFCCTGDGAAANAARGSI